VLKLAGHLYVYFQNTLLAIVADIGLLLENSYAQLILATYGLYSLLYFFKYQPQRGVSEVTCGVSMCPPSHFSGKVAKFDLGLL
jgi:hypothetical protein